MLQQDKPTGPTQKATNILNGLKPMKWGIGAWANGFLASLFLTLFIRCMITKDQDKDALWNARLNDVKTMTQQTVAEKTSQARAEMQPQIEEMKSGIDTLTQKLDSVKKRKL
jgi:hypothetical protein